MNVILKFEDISKTFPGVKALDNVSFEIKSGTIHGLMGQNGAGKSTLMKILCGYYLPDKGVIVFDGNQVNINSPKAAHNMGISIVYQELSLLDNLSVSENIWLGNEYKKNAIFIDKQKCIAQTKEFLEQLGINDIDPNIEVGLLPIAKRQMVEIVRAISLNPRLLILDEPTAALMTEDIERLFEMLKNLKNKGVTIILITHKLKEILQNCDYGTVLRNGRFVKTVKIADVSEEDLVKLMIGKELKNFYLAADNKTIDGEPILKVNNLSVGKKVKNISFEIKRGEILGITGLLGAGQNELARALYGIVHNVSGEIIINGKHVFISNPNDAINYGIGLLTEDRNKEGLFLDLNVKENVTLPSINKYRNKVGLINNTLETSDAEEYLKKVNIIMSSLKQLVSQLSGGNRQKVILSRWLLKKLDILILIEPTVGIDVEAKAEIYNHLNNLAKEGKAIIIISKDTQEILGVSNRILVMYDGKILASFDGQRTTEEELLLAVQGEVR